MDLGTVQTAISTLGFPIVIAIALMWFIWKLWNKTQDQNDKREEKLYAVISQAQEQNEKLSQTNSAFVNVLENYKSDLETIKTDVADIKQQLN
jgi:F0F1-type ATP synthase membrane subunit b/b'